MMLKMNTMFLTCLTHFLLLLLPGTRQPCGQSRSVSEAAKILVPGPIADGIGHVQVLSTLASRLVDLGHNITLLSGSPKCSEKFATSNATQIVDYESPSFAVTMEVPDELAIDTAHYFYQPMSYRLQLQRFSSMLGMVDRLVADCRAILNDNELLENLKTDHFDLLIGDTFGPCDIFIANALGVPWIAVTANRQYFSVSNVVYRVPAEVSYVPVIGAPILGSNDKSDEMTFIERVHNTLHYLVLNFVIVPYFFKDFVTLKDEFDIAPNKDLWEMFAGAEVWLTQPSSVLDFPGPRVPNVIPVGGLGLRPSKPLPEDLEEFVAGSGQHGIIIFSLGSVIDSLPDAPQKDMIFRVLSQLPQRVLVKHSEPVPAAYIGDNVKIMQWLPQNDLLGHSKARLYIAHGGLNGIYESIYHAVPMIVIPLLFDDHWENANLVANKGIGIRLEKSDLTEERFKDAITMILNGTKYQETVSHYSEILRDTQPMETAVYWIEHVLKFGGSHLRPKAYKLSWTQYHLIDVAVVLIIAMSVMVFLFCYMVIRCYRWCVLYNTSHLKVE